MVKARCCRSAVSPPLVSSSIGDSGDARSYSSLLSNTVAACVCKCIPLYSVSLRGISFCVGVGGRGSSGTFGGEEERVGQDLEQARSG